MDISTFRDYCLSLKGAGEKFPFGEDTLVFYVGGKMFCLTDIETFGSINVKCDPEKAVLLREEYEDVMPGYHMSKKHWNTVLMSGKIPDKLILKWVKESYDLVIAGLPRKLRDEVTGG